MFICESYIIVSSYNCTLSIPDTVCILYEGLSPVVTWSSVKLMNDLVIYHGDESNYNDIYILYIPDRMSIL